MTRFVILLAVVCLVLVAFNPGLIETGWTVALFFAFIGLFMPKGAKETCFVIAAVAFAATFVGANYDSEIRTFAIVAMLAGILWVIASFAGRRRRRQRQARSSQRQQPQEP
ncbi:MAG TPA: hypothetical protein VIF43_04390 [Patescibacteria group bacterium]|jgi:predicted membrane protein